MNDSDPLKDYYTTKDDIEKDKKDTIQSILLLVAMSLTAVAFVILMCLI